MTDCQNNLMSDRLLKESNVIAALRGLLESPSMQEVGTGISFLPEVAAAVHNVPETDVVPLDYHERCMELVTQRNIAQEPNRVLTLEEIIDKVLDAVGGVPVWIEHINDTEQKLAWKLSGWKVVRGAERCVLIFGTGHSVSTENINKTWRCWLRKPTAEEMESTPWESKKEDEK